MFNILRSTKNPTDTDKLWDDIKLDICLYLKNNGAKKIDIILNNQKTKVIGVNCIDLNIHIKFYTCIISQESKDDNILLIQKIDDTINKINCVSNMNSIPKNFYNIILN